MAGFTEMSVDSIRVHMPTGQHVVILKEKEAERYLPIWIGINEANAIALRITGITPDRPITHDLLCNLLGSVECAVEKIEVTSLSNDVFFARIIAKQSGNSLVVDARPSDAIAVAVRVGAAIYVADEVLDKAGVLPEQEKEEAAEGSGEGGEGREITDEKLTIFREMVNSMDLPDLGSEGRGGAGGAKGSDS
jgi:bifunctional DNase/RNase